MFLKRFNQKVEVRAVITRADGTVEDLGVIATTKIGPFTKFVYIMQKLYYKLKNMLKFKKGGNK